MCCTVTKLDTFAQNPESGTLSHNQNPEPYLHNQNPEPYLLIPICSSNPLTCSHKAACHGHQRQHRTQAQFYSNRHDRQTQLTRHTQAISQRHTKPAQLLHQLQIRFAFSLRRQARNRRACMPNAASSLTAPCRPLLCPEKRADQPPEKARRLMAIAVSPRPASPVDNRKKSETASPKQDMPRAK